MNRLISLVVTLVALVGLNGAGLHAQDMTGTWQGTLQPPNANPIRLVFKITKADDGSLKTVLYNIEQPSPGLGASATSFQGSTLRVTIAATSMAYEGRLNADGSSLDGTFTQGPGKLPLTLVHASGDAAWAIPEPPVPLKPMAADAVVAFEVATIKPSEPGQQGKGFRVQGRQFSTRNTSLSDLIGFTYGMHARQITGGPAWLESEKYDIVARPDGEGQPNEKQWKAMVEKLMAERFQLTFHRDKKELAVYAIVAGRTGAKLTKSEGDPNGLPGIGFRALGAMAARNASMVDLASVLQGSVLDRPVVDQSGVAGRYDFSLNWTPDEFQFPGLRVPPPADNAAAPPNLFTAFQEQLGLRLEATKAPADVLVIDRVEKPSPD